MNEDILKGKWSEMKAYENLKSQKRVVDNGII